MSWMQVGITTMIEWPTSDTRVEYAGKQFLLRCSKYKFHGPDILCEFSETSNINAYRSILEFMSVLAWLKGQAIEERIHGSTSSSNEPPMTGPAPFTQNICEHFRLEIFPNMSHPKAALGLALFREALCTRSVPLRFLGFWKLVSLIEKDGEPEQKELLFRTIPKLANSSARERVQELLDSTTNNTDLEIVRKHLYKSRRCAIAHATLEDVINPDDPIALKEINCDMPLIIEIAKQIIQDELGIKTEETLYKEAGLAVPQSSNKAVSPYLGNFVSSWKQVVPGKPYTIDDLRS